MWSMRLLKRDPERLSTKVSSVSVPKDHLRKWSALRGRPKPSYRSRHHLDDATTKRSIELLIPLALACMRWKAHVLMKCDREKRMID